MTLLGICKLDKPKTWMKGGRERDTEGESEEEEEVGRGGRLEGSLRNRVVSALPSG